MRYMAKVLKAALEKKFPEAAEKDVLKVSDKNISLDISCLQLNYKLLDLTKLRFLLIFSTKLI